VRCQVKIRAFHGAPCSLLPGQQLTKMVRIV
jgi:hypothetical protein